MPKNSKKDAKSSPVYSKLADELTGLRFRLQSPIDTVFHQELVYLAEDVDRYLQCLDTGGNVDLEARCVDNMRCRIRHLKEAVHEG